MNIINENISIDFKSPILFSHIKDIPKSSSHLFHLHDYYEIYIYVSGDVNFIIKDKYISLHQGNIVLVQDNILHKPVINSQIAYERFYIGIPINAFWLITNGNSPISFFQKSNEIVGLSGESFKTAFSLLYKISNNIKSHSADTYISFSYLLQFLKLINNANSKETDSSEILDSKPPSLITQVLNFIENTPTACNNIQDLADHFHVNASYLSTTFANTTHVTLKKYITSKKISIAKNMILADKSLTEIALECGFSSCSHFISVFKKYTGKTPKDYKKENT